MKHLTLAALAVTLAFPAGALADLNSTATLSVGSTLSLDTGTISTTGGDIEFTGTTITFQGSAQGGNIGTSLGASGFNALMQATLQELAALESTTPIPSADLVVGDVFAVATNGGNAAKVLITTVSSSSITLQYTTYGASASGGGGTGTSGGPTVTSVVNNYSYLPTGFPNSGIAPGTIMTIFGSNMSAAPSGTVTLQSSAGGGIPKMLAGATLSVTVGGTTVTPAMYYATPGQIAAVLPSGTPTGSATLTVSYNGAASAPFSFQVVPSALGFDTYFGTGSGLLTATSATSGALFNYTNSISPSETIVLWGSGLGADTADSDTTFTTTPHAVSTPLLIYIGGVQAEILYSGSSGYPGLNQIDVKVPANVPTGCNVSVVGVAGSGASATSSNFGALPFNQGGGECTDSAFGITGTTIGTLSGQSTVRYGDLLLGQLVEPVNGAPQTTNIAIGDFESVTGASYASSTSGGSVSLGGCIVSEIISTSSTTIPTINGLNAGTINLMGPAGTYPLMSYATGSYVGMLPDGAITSSGGTFTFTGSGGSDVGSFTTTVNLPNPLLDWTNQSAAATINRAEGVQITWTGGASGSLVGIFGNSSNSTTFANGSFICFANQSAGGFMVPGYVTSTLPSGTGTVTVENITNFGSFKATGIDYGFTYGFTGATVNTIVQ